MRKLVSVALVAFSTTVFALGGLSQPRRRTRARRAVPTEQQPVLSPRIAQELGQIRWGMSHDQVLEYYRQLIRATYQPRMKNLGQIERYRLNEERNEEIRTVERSYVVFDGAPAHRRWDTSFIGDEYTHNNNESMLVYEDARHNREFMFFINDRLWKRVQARNVGNARINLDDFSVQLESLFGPGHRVMNGSQLRTVEWRDETTRLHLVDATTFYNAFCLVYSELATEARLATLRRNVPASNTHDRGRVDIAQPETGNVVADPNADIVDRITGKIRRVQNADAGAAAAASVRARPATGSTNSNRDAGPSATELDPLGGLGF